MAEPTESSGNSDKIYALDMAMANAITLQVLCWTLVHKGIISADNLAGLLEASSEGLPSRNQQAIATILRDLAAGIRRIEVAK